MQEHLKLYEDKMEKSLGDALKQGERAGVFAAVDMAVRVNKAGADEQPEASITRASFGAPDCAGWTAAMRPSSQSTSA